LSEKGTLTMNSDLIRAPQECIDYVVTHELCHLKHKDHSTKFYKTSWKNDARLGKEKTQAGTNFGLVYQKLYLHLSRIGPFREKIGEDTCFSLYMPTKEIAD